MYILPFIEPLIGLDLAALLGVGAMGRSLLVPFVYFRDQGTTQTQKPKTQNPRV